MPTHACTLIAAAVVRRRGELLLVQQRYPGDSHPYWGLPGGWVEPGEELLVGLERELHEETGLTLIRPPTLAFVLQILRQTQEGHQQWLACHFACEVEGQLGPHDPDGLVLSAHWVEEQTALAHLETDPQYPCEPLRSFLGGAAAPGVVYSFRATGASDGSG